MPPILLLTKGLNVHNNQYELLAEKLQRLLLQEGFDTNVNDCQIPGVKDTLEEIRNLIEHQCHECGREIPELQERCHDCEVDPDYYVPDYDDAEWLGYIDAQR